MPGVVSWLVSSGAVVGVGFLVVWLVLGMYAIRKAKPEDIPAVIRALSRWGRK
ncbi:hypothetical protein [Microbispora rosea]|uniref:hypothetical protein n=1 Tax=Microbispora rosea TaxID=58117 RepID=UPI0037A7D54D